MIKKFGKIDKHFVDSYGKYVEPNTSPYKGWDWAIYL